LDVYLLKSKASDKPDHRLYHAQSALRICAARVPIEQAQHLSLVEFTLV